MASFVRQLSLAPAPAPLWASQAQTPAGQCRAPAARPSLAVERRSSAECSTDGMPSTSGAFSEQQGPAVAMPGLRLAGLQLARLARQGKLGLRRIRRALNQWVMSAGQEGTFLWGDPALLLGARHPHPADIGHVLHRLQASGIAVASGLWICGLHDGCAGDAHLARGWVARPAGEPGVHGRVLGVVHGTIRQGAGAGGPWAESNALGAGAMLAHVCEHGGGLRQVAARPRLAATCRCCSASACAS